MNRQTRRLAALALAGVLGPVWAFAQTPPPWTPIQGNETNMIVVGYLYLDGQPLTAPGYWIASHGPGGIDRDCRSIGRVGNPDWGLQPGQYYCTVRGNDDGESISFLIWDENLGQVLPVDDSVVYQRDDLHWDLELNVLRDWPPPRPELVGPDRPAQPGGVHRPDLKP